MFGNVESLKVSLMKELCVFDGLEEVRTLTAKEKLKKSLIIRDLEKVTLMEEIS